MSSSTFTVTLVDTDEEIHVIENVPSDRVAGLIFAMDSFNETLTENFLNIELDPDEYALNEDGLKSCYAEIEKGENYEQITEDYGIDEDEFDTVIKVVHPFDAIELYLFINTSDLGYDKSLFLEGVKELFEILNIEYEDVEKEEEEEGEEEEEEEEEEVEEELEKLTVQEPVSKD